jgi:hypothetical protein
VSVRALIVCVACAVVVVTAAWARATVVRSVEFPEQCAQAATIVVGTVRTVESRPSMVAGYFETSVTFAVEEVVAGTASGELTLRLAGGQVGNVRQSIDGMPEFVAGERYVVFVEPPHDPPLVSPIVGFNQGLYRVTRDSGREVVRDRAGRPLAESAVAAVAAATPPSDARALAPLTESSPSLESFLAAVKASRPR